MTTEGRDLRSGLTGHAAGAMRRFYALLPSFPAEGRPALLVGLGYNFEFYDALFPVMLAHIQLSMDDGPYTDRYRAVQSLLRPYCSEFGFDPGAAPKATHRELYAEFFQRATGSPHPEKYPGEGENPWLDAARRWTRRMHAAISCPEASDLSRARFNAGYFWAVEHLSIEEMTLLTEAWGKAGVRAAYLDAHCEVEGDHDRWSLEGVALFAPLSDPDLRRGVSQHEEQLAGFYQDLRRILETAVQRGSARASSAR